MSEYFVHPTSIIDDGVVIEEGTKIDFICDFYENDLEWIEP